MANYVQPDYRNPTVSSSVGTYNLTLDALQADPVPIFVQPGTAAPAKQVTVQNGVSQDPMQL